MTDIIQRNAYEEPLIRYDLINNPDLDLFAKNKVGVSMAGTFSHKRSGSATYKNVYGALTESPNPTTTNLIPYSEDINNVAWTQPRTVATTTDMLVDKITATEATNNAYQHQQTITAPSTGIFTLSVFVQRGSVNNYMLKEDTHGVRVGVDLDSGIITGVGSGNITAKVTAIGDLYRVQVQFEVTNTALLVQGYLKSEGGVSESAILAVGDYLYSGGFQLEDSTIANGYVKTDASAVTGESYFGIEQFRPESAGYRFEGTSTNLFLNSLVGVTQAITIVNGQDYTLSINEGAGSITITGGGTGVATLGNDVTFTATSTTATFTVAGQSDKVNVENLPFATSYIPTTVAPVTRTADENSAPYYANMPRGDQAFTIRFKGVIGGATGLNYLFGSSVETSQNQLRVFSDSAGSLQLTNGGDVGRSPTLPVTFGELFDYIITSDGITYKSYLGGALETTSSVTTPATELPTDLTILRGSVSSRVGYGNCSIFQTWIGEALTAEEIKFISGGA